MAMNQNQVKNLFISTIVLANATGRMNEVAYIAELDGIFAYKVDATLVDDGMNVLTAAGTDAAWVRMGSQSTVKVTFVADVVARDALTGLEDNEFAYVAETFMWQRYDLAATSWVDEGTDFTSEEVLLVMDSDLFITGTQTFTALLADGTYSAPSGGTAPALFAEKGILLVNGLHEYNALTVNAELSDDANINIPFGVTGDDVLQFISAIALPSATIEAAYKAKFG